MSVLTYVIGFALPNDKISAHLVSLLVSEPHRGFFSSLELSSSFFAWFIFTCFPFHLASLMSQCG